MDQGLGRHFFWVPVSSFFFFLNCSQYKESVCSHMWLSREIVPLPLSFYRVLWLYCAAATSILVGKCTNFSEVGGAGDITEAS